MPSKKPNLPPLGLKRSRGKTNPKGTEALNALKACEQAILDDRGLPRSVADEFRFDWYDDPIFRLRIWLAEISELPIGAVKNPALACSALLQVYLRTSEIPIPAGIFKDDLRSPGRGRRPEFDAGPILSQRFLGRTYGQIGRELENPPETSQAEMSIKARNLVKSAESRLRRPKPIDGPIFDLACRMLGIKSADQIYEERLESGELDPSNAIPADPLEEFD